MCDATKAISNAFRLVFGDDIIELMCWFHAKCAMGDHVANLIPKNEQNEVISDIDVLQLSQTPDMFRKASELFLEKYAKHEEFIAYFKEQWLTLHPNWYEGVCTPKKAPSNNNGLEVFNRSIKGEKTMRKRLPLQIFFNQLLTWIKTWGARYVGGASEILANPRIDLPLMVPAGNEKDLSKSNHCLLEWKTFNVFKTNTFMGWWTVVPENTWIEGRAYFKKI